MTADLTAARIRRANRGISKVTAQRLAAELHGIIAEVCAFCAARWGYDDADRAYLTQLMLREIINDHPPGDYAAYHAACVAGDFQAARATDYNAACNTSEWLAIEIVDPGVADDLYRRYMRLWCRINNEDYEGIMGSDEEAAADTAAYNARAAAGGIEYVDEIIENSIEIDHDPQH